MEHLWRVGVSIYDAGACVHILFSPDKTLLTKRISSYYNYVIHFAADIWRCWLQLRISSGETDEGCQDIPGDTPYLLS